MTIPNDTGPRADDFTHSIDTLKHEAEAIEGVNADNAEAARDVIARAQQVSKRVEAARKEAKQPHLDASKAVDAEFKPLKEALDGIANTLKKALSDFLLAEERRRQQEAEAARKAAEEAAAFAAEADMDDELAERAAKFAQKRQEQAQQAEQAAADKTRVGSQDGIARAASLRTYRYAEITHPAATANHYINHPDLLATLEKLANADIRAAKGEAVTIPGVAVREEKRVA